MILAKDLKNQPLNTDKSNYKDLIKQFVKVYEKQPEIMKKYLYQKKGNTSQSINNQSQGQSYSQSQSQNQSQNQSDKSRMVSEASRTSSKF